MHFSRLTAVLLFLVAAACTPVTLPKANAGISTAPTTTTSLSAEARMAKALLSDLQAPSFRQSVEYCGYVGYNRAGVLTTTTPVRGNNASCLPKRSPDMVRVTASYHTHGGFDPRYTGELPSIEDVEGDTHLGINGYVSTPGGRFWFVNSTTQQITQLCGFGCLPNDPRFARGGDGPISQSYSAKQLWVRLNVG